jgi:hypothetical protein
MNRLVIRQFGGPDIAEVSQNAAKRLQLVVLVPELEEELRMLLARLSAGPLPLRTGRRVEARGTTAHETVVRQVSSTDPGFLGALSDALARERVGGRRVRGVLVEE